MLWKILMDMDIEPDDELEEKVLCVCGYICALVLKS